MAAPVAIRGAADLEGDQRLPHREVSRRNRGWVEWRSHPLVVIVSVGFGCVMGTATVFQDVIFPTRIAQLQKELGEVQEDLEKRAADLNELKAALDAARAKIEERRDGVVNR